MTAAPGWAPYLTDADLAVLDAAGYRGSVGLGTSVALLVVDATYAFCGDAPMPILEAVAHRRHACGEQAWQAVEVMAGLVATARGNGVPVIYTKPGFTGRASERGLWDEKNARRDDDEYGSRIVAELTPEPDDLVIVKEGPSGFFGTGLLSRLMKMRVDSLLVCGGTTSGCVRATVVDAFSYNLRTSVVADATFDRVPASHWMSLFDMRLKYADLLTVEESRSALRQRESFATD